MGLGRISLLSPLARFSRISLDFGSGSSLFEWEKKKRNRCIELILLFPMHSVPWSVCVSIVVDDQGEGEHRFKSVAKSGTCVCGRKSKTRV